MAVWRLAAGLAVVLMAASAAAQDAAPKAQAPPAPGVSGMAGGASSPAQQAMGAVQLGYRAPQGPTGGVTGRVVAADTQQAVRFAQVMLVPVASVTENSGRGRFYAFGGSGNARTDLDGNFTITNVAVGDYYVTAQATGYVNPMSLIQAQAAQTGQDPASLLGSVPQVHVAVGAPSNVSLQIEHGGVIAGRMMWDDNTPAAGLMVNAVTQQGSNTATHMRLTLGGFSGSGYATTDDRGDFRISGLAPGTYLVMALLQAPLPSGSQGTVTRSTSIQVYAPGKVRRMDATAITLARGEEHDDVQFMVDLRALHSVSGRVGAASGAAVVSGTVRLTDSADGSLYRVGYVGADGSFTVPYVPEGNYTLTVTGASTAVPSYGGRHGGGSPSSSGVSFQPFSESVAVTDSDVSGMTINLTQASQ